MTISSRTPEGEPQRCAVCGAVVVMEISSPLEDACCPACGSLLFWFRDRLGAAELLGGDLRLDASLEELGLESLDAVELVMELEEEFDVSISDEEAERIRTVGEAIRLLRRRRGEEQ